MAIILPFPHGTGSGQIANGAVYTDADTPGSTGGRFVGFGEAGTSSIANRAAWALSRNIDTIFTSVLSVPISASKEKFFTTASGNGNRVQITDTVFCGDNGTGYPGGAVPSVMGMRMLFSVLNPITGDTLLDTSGNEVRVYTVNESTDSTVKYNQGFITNPWVHFCTVNTAGTVVNNSYIIPNGTSVRLVYGAQTYLKDMPTDHVDAFTRYRSSSGSNGGSNAGVVLVDGSRAMTGNLSLGTHDLTNVTNIYGSTSTHILTVKSVVEQRLVAGDVPTIDLIYLPTGSESNALTTVASLVLDADSTPNSRATVALWSNPAHPTTTSSQLILTLASTNGGSISVGLDGVHSPPTFRAFTAGIDLGDSYVTWGTGWFSAIHLPSSEALYISAGPYRCEPVLVEKGKDYEFFDDFARPNINSSTSEVISDFLMVGGTGSQIFQSVTPSDRYTVAALTTSSGVTDGASLVGPLLADIAVNSFRHKIAFSLPFLSGSSGITYAFASGFGDNSNLLDVANYGCWLFIDTDKSVFFSHRQNGGGWVSAVSLTLASDTWYEFEIVLNISTVDLLLNGVSALSGGPVAFVAEPTLYYTPAQILKYADPTQGGTGISAYIDYIHLYSTGHIPR